jgi:AI-2 transport protein TqsA
MGPEKHVTSGIDSRTLGLFFATVLAFAILYVARILFEPIAFALFGMALVWPVQEALAIRVSKPIALAITLIVALVVLSVLVLAIVWSIGDIVHWISDNTTRFKSIYVQYKEWLADRNIFLAGAPDQFDSRAFVGVLKRIAGGVNYLIGFFLVVFLFLVFGLTELDDFRRKFSELEPKIGWDIRQAASNIAQKIRKYMFIRTLASLLTGVAVFVFTLSIGLDLAIAWGVISFVLNYIPYIGPLVAVVIPVIFAIAQFGSWEKAIVIFGGLYVIQFVIGNYLEPIIAGKALAISPFVMLFAFFFWDFLWGMPGAFIGLPVTIALFTICEQNQSSRWIANLLSSSPQAIR